MEQANTSVTSQRINNFHAQTFRPSLPFYLDLAALPALVRPNGRELLMKNPEYDPNGFKPNIKQLICTTLTTLTVKTVLFAIPPLIIGIVFRSQCPIQEWIPRFLMGLGIEHIVENLSLCIVFLILKIILRKPSEAFRHKKLELVKTIWSGVGTICTLAWIIAGSVWTFSVKSQVQFDHVQKPTYCHPGPYWFAFILCILWYAYVLIALFCIPCIWKWQKSVLEAEKALNPVQINIGY